MALAPNVIQNMTTNYCYLYNCHEIRAQLKAVIEESNGKKLEIYRVLVSHFGRVISSKRNSFVGELNQEIYYTLLDDLNKDLFMKVRERKKYPKHSNIYITFLVM